MLSIVLAACLMAILSLLFVVFISCICYLLWPQQYDHPIAAIKTIDTATLKFCGLMVLIFLLTLLISSAFFLWPLSIPLTAKFKTLVIICLVGVNAACALGFFFYITTKQSFINV